MTARPLAVAALLVFAPPASAQFRDVTPLLPPGTGTSTGVSWADYDGDGALDLFVTTYGSEPDNQRNRLLRNEGASGFADVTTQDLEGLAHFSTGAAWGDYDDDGDPDLFVASESPDGISLFRNDGSGVFEDVTPPVLRTRGSCYGAAWVDTDRDGDLDLSLASRDGGRLLRNDGGGGFADVTRPPLDTPTWCVKWCDWDSDGDPDAFLGTPQGTPLVMARNDGRGGFRDAAGGSLGGLADGAFSGDFSDYDGDGDLDLYVTYFWEAARLFRNDVGAFFTDVTTPTLGGTGTSYTAMWADYDNDGDEDLFRCGLLPGSTALLRNREGIFENVTPLLGSARQDTVWSAAWADWDGDGRLDLYLGEARQNPDRLLRNEMGAGRHWLSVDLEGTLSNRAGVGARVEVQSGSGTRIAEISGGGDGWCSQEPACARFGMGFDTEATLRVTWPSGQRQTLSVVDVDTRVTVREPGLSPAIEAFPAGQGFEFNLALDHAQITHGTLHLRRAATAEPFTVIPMLQIGDVVLRALVPDSLASPSGIEYFVEYRLNDGTPRLTPFDGAAGPDFLPAAYDSLPAPSQLAARQFALFGFPFETSDSTVTALLEDDFGPYDPEVWKVGRWDPALRRYREPADSAFALGRGRGFWLISQSPMIPDAAGRSSNPHEGVEIVLESGWNQVAHPFLFEVDLDDVDFSRAVNVERRLVTYRGGGYVEGTVLQPWRGYWMHNESLSPEVIVVPGIAPGGARSGADAAPPEPGWRIAVNASQGPTWDRGNEAGTMTGAGAPADREDLREPPGLPEHVRVWFETPARDGSLRALTRDLRPETAEGHVWDLVVEGGGAAPVLVSFDGVRDLRQDLVPALLVDETFALVDLLTDPELELPPGRTHRFRLVVGTPSYVEAVRSGALDPPAPFALGLPWPNPFVRDARIGFVLPRDARVSLAVHDVGGRLVRTIVSGPLPAGTHEVRWQGIDERGRAVGSGVYFLRLRADDRLATRKLLLRR